MYNECLYRLGNETKLTNMFKPHAQHFMDIRQLGSGCSFDPFNALGCRYLLYVLRSQLCNERRLLIQLDLSPNCCATRSNSCLLSTFPDCVIGGGSVSTIIYSATLFFDIYVNLILLSRNVCITLTFSFINALKWSTVVSSLFTCAHTPGT